MDKIFSIAGVVIVGIITYLFIRNKGSNSILESNFEQAVSIEEQQNLTDIQISETQQRLDNHVIQQFSEAPQQTSSRSARFRREQFFQGIKDQTQQKKDLQAQLSNLLGIRKSLKVSDALSV
ncbi:MAG: hypothetical protein HOF89_02670 [Candidatus Nitrosopelagicus sp.]|nr:hypothetical protein [Candidatus Nitrosopelagicus sp.]